MKWPEESVTQTSTFQTVNKLVRRFRKTETIAHVLDFLEGLDNLPIEYTVSVCTSYPLTLLTRDKSETKLYELTISKNLSLNVSIEPGEIN
jgi:UBX domain